MAKKTPELEMKARNHKFFKFSETIPLKELFDTEEEEEVEDEEELHGNRFSSSAEVETTGMKYLGLKSSH